MATETTRPSAERWATTMTQLDVTVPGVGSVPLTFNDRDRTRPFLLLHGGAGPASVAAFGDLLAARDFARVLVPTHPGFDGSPRPERLTSMRDLARTYVTVLEELDLYDVTVIGNSLGGWLAAEIAILGSARVSGAVVIDAVGAVVEGEPVADVRTMTPAELVARSFADPSRAPAPGPGGPAPELVQANMAALFTYGGPSMSDPSLLGRLGEIELPVQVVWGASDRIVSPAYGAAFAAAIPGASFTVLKGAGHLPQLEAPEQLLGVIHDLGERR